MRKWLTLLLAFLAVVGSGCAGSSRRGEIVASVYGGRSLTYDADVHYERSAGTDLRFDDVSFKDDSWTSPYYYGLRGTYWFPSKPCWGMALDFTHLKATAKTEKTTQVSGT